MSRDHRLIDGPDLTRPLLSKRTIADSSCIRGEKQSRFCATARYKRSSHQVQTRSKAFGSVCEQVGLRPTLDRRSGSDSDLQHTCGSSTVASSSFLDTRTHVDVFRKSRLVVRGREEDCRRSLSTFWARKDRLLILNDVPDVFGDGFVAGLSLFRCFVPVGVHWSGPAGGRECCHNRNQPRCDRVHRSPLPRSRKRSHPVSKMR